MGVYNDVMFTEAIDQVEALIASTSADEIGERIEQIAHVEDLAQICLMLLIMKAKGIDTSGASGISLANPAYSVRDLILPPGLTL